MSQHVFNNCNILQMAALATEVIEDMKETFQKMFEGILTFTQTVSKQMDLSVGVGQLSAKYWKSMFNICFDVLAKVVWIKFLKNNYSKTLIILTFVFPTSQITIIQIPNIKSVQCVQYAIPKASK